MMLGDFPLYFMETLKRWRSLHGYIVVFMFLSTVSKACEPPSSPQCFRRKADESIYRCEWSMNTTESDVTFDLYFNETKYESKKNWREIFEEQLIKHRPVYIWVEAHVGNSSCKSTRRSVVLANTVKYEAPQNIFMSWLKNNLNLSWTAAEKHPALAEVRFRRHPTESWENRLITTNATDGIYTYQVDLLKNSSHQVQIRHKSTQASDPLWSDWSPVVIVPAACEPPSSPQCFRRKADESIYRCEWSMNTTESDVTFDLYFNETKFESKNTWREIFEEQLIKHRPVYIWVEAHVGNSSCKSTWRSVVLANTVKYEAPQNIFMSWLKNNLNLSWTAAEKHPALAEVRFRRHPTESWENRLITTNTTDGIYTYQVDLLKNSSHQVQIRHKSTQASDPLWSDWSPVVIVPAACEPPSSPQCFRRKADESIYRCEWSMNTTESDVTFDLYFNETKFESKNTWREIFEEDLIKHRPVYIWVEAHVGNSDCKSTWRSVVLANTVKYEAPQNIFMSWLKNNLNLSWTAAEKHPALAEVRFRRHPTESWENRLITTNATDGIYTYQVDLLKNSSHQVQIRHKSTQASDPLWSDWSPVVIVPAGLEEKPEVTMTTRLLNGTRKVMLKWKPVPHAAAVTGVMYSLNDTQSSRGCPCQKKRHQNNIIKTNECTTYVSYSAVNISVIARNAAGSSPPAIVQIPAEPAHFEICNKTLLDEKLNRKTCLELYKLQDGDSRPETVITLTKKGRKQRKNIEDYVRYLYFEHRCAAGKPRTVKMCLFYQKEDAPISAPQDLIAFAETHSSADVSWKVIPSEDQRGFLTHYSLCSVKISSQDEPKECYNISASLIKYRLENLTPGAKYNISLAGATGVGEGPEATVIINTLPEKPVNVWWSLGLLFVFFFISTLCTLILKRVKSKIFPPVPKPVIQDLTSYPASQEMLEREEEVHELTLHQLHPEGKSVTEDPEETTFYGGECDDGTDEDVENERSDSRMSGGTSDECLSPGSTDKALRSSREGEVTDLEQVENEIAMLIYRNGLVFDVKTESP